jgi:hypothetical protein
VDVTGFEWTRAMTAIDAYSDVSKLMDKYYPTRINKLLLVNSPWIFEACWKIAKAIIDENTREFISMLFSSSFWTFLFSSYA